MPYSSSQNFVAVCSCSILVSFQPVRQNWNRTRAGQFSVLQTYLKNLLFPFLLPLFSDSTPMSRWSLRKAMSADLAVEKIAFSNRKSSSTSLHSSLINVLVLVVSDKKSFPSSELILPHWLNHYGVRKYCAL